MIFPSKILVLGEYALVAGGSGLAIPFYRFSGELNFSSVNSEIANHSIYESNCSLRNLFHFLISKNEAFSFLNLAAFKKDIEKGLWFKSNIPEGYGLGSSAALVAALYHKYALNRNVSIEELKQHLAKVESYFHGQSSGVDPLVSYLKRPIVVVENEPVMLAPSWLSVLNGFSLYLVDTGIQSETKEHVAWFRQQMLEAQFTKQAGKTFLQPTLQLVNAAANGEPFEYEKLKMISAFQLANFSAMIPRSFQKHFRAGLNSRNFVFKLCGSGGGGFMLAFSSQIHQFEKYCSDNRLRYIKVDDR
ncbi:MAG: hypothetical protein JXR50_05695 [Prolixibacteraceae bacterium]|nr:hypothetical protein [Prolixibacteraceae bacterium]MBN2649219.1 hypothetical protein [Prolixibacteraceae bacterium]